VTLTLEFGLLFKNFNLDYNFQTIRDRALILAYMYSLGQGLLFRAIIFDIDNATLTLEFELLFKNFNLDHNSQTIRDRTFILVYMYSSGQGLPLHVIIFDLVTLTLPFDLLFTTFNLDRNSQTIRDRVFILAFMYFVGQGLPLRAIILTL